MMRRVKVSCGLMLGILLMSQGYAEAPVVDDSDHFTVFDDDGVRPPPTAAIEAPKQQQLAVNDTPIVQTFPEEKSQDVSLPGQIRALQQDVQALRGELEVQAHTIEQLKQDLDTRLNNAMVVKQPSSNIEVPVAESSTKTGQAAPSAVEVNTPPPVSNAVKTGLMPANAMNPADEQIAYLAAYDLVKAKRYSDALTAMQAFVKQYPTGGYTANAEYWMGELYLAKSEPVEAMKHFDIVLHQFPNSSKAAASALKMGYALSALGKKDEAKQRLREVIKNYPDTAAAQLAKSKLESL
ncbi:MAG: tol-pal system protein YbgF [Gammaproteobacteria bacterium]|nr:tol-pal system protein YbgF [Gammaproteobacteria bacterium]